MKLQTAGRGLLSGLVFPLFSGVVLAVFALTANAAPREKPCGVHGRGQVSCSIDDPGMVATNTPVEFSGCISGGKAPYTVTWTFSNATPADDTQTDVPEGPVNGATTFNATGPQTVTLDVADSSKRTKTCTTDYPVLAEAVGGIPTARNDTYGTPDGKELIVQLSRVSGVLYNDFDTDAVTGEPTGNSGLTAVKMSDPAHGTVNLAADGSFVYTPDGSQHQNDNDSFTYKAVDGDGQESAVATVNIHIESDQPDFKIMMNYELGMHCTGFEFSYCCVLPPYNSILAQVVKPQKNQPDSNADYPRLLEGDPNNGLDALARPTVLRDYDADGNIHKYYLEYFHDAQPRREGNSPNTQNSTLISAVEGNSLLYHNTPYDSAMVDGNGKLVTGEYAGLHDVVLGDGDFGGPADNFANGWLNHFYIYTDLEGTVPGECAMPAGNAGNTCISDEDCDSSMGAGDGSCDTAIATSRDSNKIRMGVNGHVTYPADCGAALQPMGPDTAHGMPIGNDRDNPDNPLDVNTCDGFSEGNVLTFSGDKGTVYYTQMKVLENLPIMLTSPRIWEALGLPLTPFEDTINFFGEPGAVDEDSIRPYVAMKARLLEASCNEATGECTKGLPVMASNGEPVVGFGTAPIDIPNCERCHSVPAYQDDGMTPNINSPSYVRRQDGPKAYYGPGGETLEAMVDMEINYWKSIYPSLTTGSDWYARLKGAAISIEVLHDYDVGTNFTANYPATEPLPGRPGDDIPQNTRMGHESVICQKCHADNVIAVVKSTSKGFSGGPPVPPISEAIHHTHRNQSEGGVITLNDGLGRDGGCQGCHPAHRSDGVMDGYPITLGGDNGNAGGDNRLNQGGCFVGRDVHSNPLKDVDGAETSEHLTAVGQWLQENVSRNQAGLAGSDVDYRGIWCTNCHTQLSQEIWKAEDCTDLINSECIDDIRGATDLADLAGRINDVLGTSYDVPLLEAMLDPTDNNPQGDFTHAIWDPSWADANVATIEANLAPNCNTAPYDNAVFNNRFGVYVCVALDVDGDPSVRILDFCTTPDCVAAAQSVLDAEGNGSIAAAVPFDAATDGRDHWLAGGEPHCADCHAAPYVEPSPANTGDPGFRPPFNYPRKASLMRYSTGHQGISCQGCHESIHGLYPVSPAIDTTSYAQAAALNTDGSHGPLKCGTCHLVDGDGVPQWVTSFGGLAGLLGDFDGAVGWAHTYTDRADVRATTCLNCHGDQSDEIGAAEEHYVGHADDGRTSRHMMDEAEIAQLGHVLGATAGAERDQLCTTCHEGGTDNRLGEVSCDDEWREHLAQGRVAESVWEEVSLDETGTRCGW